MKRVGYELMLDLSQGHHLRRAEIGWSEDLCRPISPEIQISPNQGPKQVSGGCPRPRVMTNTASGANLQSLIDNYDP